MKKIALSCFLFLALLIELSAQTPYKDFLYCIELLRTSDTIVNLENPVFIKISNDTIRDFEITKTERKSVNVHLVYKQEIFFNKIENHFTIGSFYISDTITYLYLVKNHYEIKKLKKGEIVTIELSLNRINNLYSIVYKRLE
jgi:hypothetical protein